MAAPRYSGDAPAAANENAPPAARGQIPPELTTRRIPSISARLTGWTKYQWLLGATGAGLLLTLAFPLAGVAGFAWIVPGMVLLAGLRDTPRRAFQTGYLFGLVFALGTLYWLNYMPVTGMPILAWIAMAGYLALYHGAWCWFARKSLPLPLTELINAPWSQRTLWILTCSAAWVLAENIVGWFLTGMPWINLGVTQHRLLPLIQITSLTGVPGLSFIIVWASVSLMFSLLALATAPRQRMLAWREICLPLLTVIVLFAWGSFRIGKIDRAIAADSRGVKIALVQPSFPQTLIWDQGTGSNRFDTMIELSREALEADPDILIWPEAGIPGLLRYDETIYEAVTGLAKKHGVWIICSGDDARFPEDNPDAKNPNYYNSAFLVTPEGEIASQYDKRRLVMFGEYVPLFKWLPFLKFLTPIGDGFTGGDQAVQLSFGDLNLKASPLICFEDVFAALTRGAVEPDTDFLVNMTNDGWFSESAEQWQHLANALFRSVETGRPLVRCANNGISCWVDPAGRVHADRFPDDRSAYSAGFKVFEMTVPAQPIATLYQRRGDWFVLACLLLVGRAAIVIWRQRSVNKSESDVSNTNT